jgi:histidine triad (HIT) family protein
MLIKGARSGFGSRIIGWMFAHMSWLLAVDRLYESPILLAFQHPKPGYPVHILIVPKRAIRDLAALAELPDSYENTLMKEVLCCVRELVQKLNLEEAGYRLIVNGGRYQDVVELHFHLVSGEMIPVTK